MDVDCSVFIVVVSVNTFTSTTPVPDPNDKVDKKIRLKDNSILYIILPLNIKYQTQRKSHNTDRLYRWFLSNKYFSNDGQLQVLNIFLWHTLNAYLN